MKEQITPEFLTRKGFKYSHAFERWYIGKPFDMISVRFKDYIPIVRIHCVADSMVIKNAKTTKDINDLIRLLI